MISSIDVLFPCNPSPTSEGFLLEVEAVQVVHERSAAEEVPVSRDLSAAIIYSCQSCRLTDFFLSCIESSAVAISVDSSSKSFLVTAF